jgi:hypothetical protein
VSDEIRAESGFLVLADISGFTAFVTATELEHGAQITGALLETVMTRLAPPLEIQEIEGDAVFAIGSDRAVPDAAALPEVLVEAFRAFKRQQEELAQDEACRCSACRRTADLDLKLIAHHGSFVRQRVGGRWRVAGQDVILVHRLLKNSVRGTAYLLVTAAALERAGVDPAATGMRPSRQRYPHLGDVSCFVADLAGVGRPRFAAAAPAA